MSEVVPENPATGLCETCGHTRQIVSGKGSRFLYCSRSETEAAYAKYPRLPVLYCPGYEPHAKDRAHD
jgi:ssDNA-binding Zn-finger/Zn-ribbon topoisomerase 1